MLKIILCLPFCFVNIFLVVRPGALPWWTQPGFSINTHSNRKGAASQWPALPAHPQHWAWLWTQHLCTSQKIVCEYRQTGLHLDECLDKKFGHLQFNAHRVFGLSVNNCHWCSHYSVESIRVSVKPNARYMCKFFYIRILKVSVPKAKYF